MSDTLTEKQRRFVEAYMGKCAGNGVEAAREAGYSGDYGTLASIASENLKKPKIQKKIDEIAEEQPLVADRKELQRFWTRKMREDESLKASKLLGKSQGDFVERHEISGPDGEPIEHRFSDLSDEEIDDKLDKLAEILDD